MKSFRRAVLLVTLIAMAGCRAHMITIKLINTSAAPLSTIIVDYPSATFGKDKLAPGETFSSPVKLTDDGALRVMFTDANGGHHAYTGPMLHASEEGSIDIKFDQNSAVAELHVRGKWANGIQLYCRSGGNHAYQSISLRLGDEGSVNIKLTQTPAETGYDLARFGKK